MAGGDVLGCGTSWHAGMLGKAMLEGCAGVPACVQYAPEWRYRKTVPQPGTVVIGVSQSGETADTVAALAERLHDRSNFLYLGRGYGFPVALEGALKLKEISYADAEGLSAAEMKHGPIPLIDDRRPVVAVAPRDGVYQKLVSDLHDVKARGGHLIVVATDPDGLTDLADHVVTVPSKSVTVE